MTYQTTFTSLATLLFIAAFSLLAVKAEAQSVSCPQCVAGICEGEAVEDYLEFDNSVSTPIDVLSLNGDINGTGTDLANYTFSDNGFGEIVLSFEDNDGNLFEDVIIGLDVEVIDATINFNQVGSCFESTFSASVTSSDIITSYQWLITDVTGGLNTPISTLGGNNQNYNFPGSGTYEICLTLTSAGGCSEQVCETQTIVGPIAGLAFLEDNNDELLTSPNDPNLIAYCNFSVNQDFDLFIADSSSHSGGGIIVNYLVELDGVEVHNSSNAPDDLLIVAEDGNYSGYVDVYIEVVDANGCIDSNTYNVYLGTTVEPQLNTAPPTSILCPGDAIPIETTSWQSNPEGVDYGIVITCDPDDENAVLESWSWSAEDPDDEIYWTPDESSCGCSENSYWAVSSASHPCNTSAIDDNVDFKVSFPSEATFTQTPSGNLCDDEMATFTWDFANLVVDGVPHCEAALEWSITDLDGNNIPINGTTDDHEMSHTFDEPSTYEVCLQVYSNCGEPTYCEAVCVNPPITDVTLDPDWNIPFLLCPGDEFTSELTYSDLDFCDTPEITWELYFEGSLIESYDGLSAAITDLEKGEYELIVNFSLEDCGEIEENVFFEVVAPPLITPEITGPFSEVCEGEVVCFDEWFCIDDCGDPLTEFELVLYEGFLADCDETPAGTIAEVITSNLPNPPYDNCDPTTDCSYEWTAEPGQYTLWIKAENNCGPDYECITIDIPFPDIPDITGDEEACIGESVSLEASLPGGSFTFISCPGTCPNEGTGAGEFTQSGSELNWNTEVGINDPGMYEVEFSGACIGTGTFTIELFPLPEFTPTSDPGTVVCAEDQVILDIIYYGPNALDGCNWINLDTGQSIFSPDCEVTVNPSPGINAYQVTVTDENGCSAQDNITVEELTAPFSADCSALQAAYCNNAGAEIDLTELLSPYPSSGNLTWELNGEVVTSTTIQLDGIDDGAYTLEWTWVHGTAPNCVFNGQCSFDVTPPTVPNINVATPYCAGEEVEITANVPGSIAGNWSFISCPGTCPNDAVLNDFSLIWQTTENTPAGTYTVEYSGDCLQTETIEFTINPIPEFSITTDPGTVICDGDEVTLGIDYTGSGTVAECFWVNENNGASISPPDCEITFTPTEATTDFSVIVTDDNGCENSADTQIEIQTQPFSMDCSAIEAAYCNNAGAEIDLTELLSPYPSSGSLSWELNGEVVTSTTIQLDGLDDGAYTLEWTWVHGTAPNCVFNGQCSFDITPPTVPSLNVETPYCAGEEVEITANVPGSIAGNWSFISCPGTCPNDAVLNDFSLIWQTAENTPSGTYTVQYSGDCLQTETIEFTINPIPEFSITTDPGTVICDGDEVTLGIDYTGSGTVAECFWVNENNSTSISPPDCEITFTPTDATTDFSVIVTDDNGCENSGDTQIDIQSQPFSMDCSAIEAAYCNNAGAEIDLTELLSPYPTSGSLTWELNGEVVTSSTIQLDGIDDGAYTLEWTWVHGTAPNCVFNGQCSFDITPPTVPDLNVETPYCAGEEVEITANVPGSIAGNWSFISCPGTCPNDAVLSDFSLIWQTTENTPSGTYTVEYSGDCLQTETIEFTINPVPEFNITTDPGATLCSDEAVTLGVNYSGAGTIECIWENITTGEILTSTDCETVVNEIDGFEVFAVSVTDENLCVSNDTIEINTQTQPFTFECPDILSFCENEEAVINFEDLVDTDPGAAAFTWFLDGNPITGGSLDIGPLTASSEPYILSYIYNHPSPPNCVFEDSCAIEISELTVPAISGNDPACLGAILEFTLSGNGGFEGEWTFTDCPEAPCPTIIDQTPTTLEWETSLTDAPGDYEISYSGTCLETVSYTFTIHPLPDFGITSAPDALICTGDEVTLGMSYQGSGEILSCTWSNAAGEISSSDCEITASPTDVSESYFVTVTDTNSCAATDSIELNIQQQPFAFDCSAINTEYCDNEDVTILFDSLVNIPSSQDFEWFLNGDPIDEESLAILDLDPDSDPYILSYIYTHPSPPNCAFADSCSFTITDLTLPELNGNTAVCVNDTIVLEAENTGGFAGDYTFIQCPDNNCPDTFESSDNGFLWITDSEVTEPGEYQIQFTGDCLDTAVVSLDVFPLPDFNIISFPGETVCAEDTITIELNYNGTANITSCELLDGDGNPTTADTDCSWTLLPSNLSGPYTAVVEDENTCTNTQMVEFDIQTQPFTYSCSLDSTYCDNSTAVINLDEQISQVPTDGDFNWFLNGAQLASNQLNIFDLSPGFYTVSYVYEHGEAPNCVFTDGCSFTVTDLVRPELSGSIGVCKGTPIELNADELEGFAGEWINTSCPNPPCIPTQTDPDTFTWPTENLPVGTYVFEYQGLCLQTETYTVEILSNPVVSWTPEDATPCLNECFPFAADELDDYDDYGWEYQTISDTVAVGGNQICFEDIGNPDVLDICLWAEAYHPVQDTVFTCYVADCEEITPVFSPDNAPELPEQACPGEELVLGVDYNFYDDCTFTLNGELVFENCESIDIPETPYGTFPYEVILGYSGCTDTLTVDVFIPEPPSATLATDYDVCVADVSATLLDLQGDALEFEWSIFDIPGNNYNYLMDDNTQEAPEPNPVPISGLDLFSDTTFVVNVSVGNFCETISLADTVNYISPPNLEIDIANTSGTQFCLPQDISFEISEFATQHIDSVAWTFQSIYDYGNISDTTYTNLQFPPEFVFENNGQTDTVYVSATAYNQCGSDGDSLSFVLIPPNVYLEMPDYASGVCPGETIQIPTEIVEGDPFDGCTVTSTPPIPGLSASCDADLNYINVTIPESTPAGDYTIETTISGCGSSTDYTQINVFPTPDVDFDIPEDACTSEEIYFENLTEGAVSFEWDFGDPGSPENESTLSLPTHSYNTPGIYTITLEAVSDSGCTAQIQKNIEIFGPDPTIAIDNNAVCSGEPFYTEFQSQDDLMSLEWEFLLPGKDTLIYTVETGVENTFENTTENVEVWNITLTLQDIYGCEAQAESEVFILPQPSAFFTHSDLNGCGQGEDIQFTNLSTLGTSSKWSFDDPGSGPENLSYTRNPTHSFTSPGDYDVNLFVQNSFGCKDDFSRRLSCSDVIVYVPNAFTPDGNRINEIFKPVIFGIHDIEFTVSNYYTFSVFNRWGDMVFTTNDPDEGWNGASHNPEYYAQSEVYIWRLNIEFPDGSKEWDGHVTLVR